MSAYVFGGQKLTPFIAASSPRPVTTPFLSTDMGGLSTGIINGLSLYLFISISLHLFGIYTDRPF